jgi:hypothetical protein
MCVYLCIFFDNCMHPKHQLSQYCKRRHTRIKWFFCTITLIKTTPMDSQLPKPLKEPLLMIPFSFIKSEPLKSDSAWPTWYRFKRQSGTSHEIFGRFTSSFPGHWKTSSWLYRWGLFPSAKDYSRFCLKIVLLLKFRSRIHKRANITVDCRRFVDCVVPARQNRSWFGTKHFKSINSVRIWFPRIFDANSYISEKSHEE